MSPSKLSRVLVAICAPWVTPVELTRGVAVLRVSLCGLIDELLVLLMAAQSPTHRHRVCQARTGSTGTALAAAYQPAHSSQWPSTRPRSHSRAIEFPAAGPSCLHSHRRTQALSQASD
jgi:hypothetical protein